MLEQPAVTPEPTALQLSPEKQFDAAIAAAPDKATDFIVYTGQINRTGYVSISDVLQHKKAKNLVLVLATPGGDAHAGFRIARALQHAYGQFDALVPQYCKSAGTLVLIGARRLYLAHRSELGPLDVQIKKDDEVMGVNSGLDIFQAVNYLHGQAMAAFRQHLMDLTANLRLSTKLAAEISAELVLGLTEPIAAQIDPIKLAQMQRAVEIAVAYGERLNATGKNLRKGGLKKVVTGYPSHGFVIDRKEARTLFTDVREPSGVLLQLSDSLRLEMEPDVNSEAPKVKIFSVPFLIEGASDVHLPDQPRSTGSDQGSQSKVDGPSKGAARRPGRRSKPAGPARAA
jgi:hypothetical protein